MDDEAKADLLKGWRLLAAGLIYPITIVAGLNAIVRIVSGCCVGLDSWTAEGAFGNFALGFPALAGLAALWVSTIHSTDWIARDRGRFVLVITGLMTGIVMECLFLRAGFLLKSPRFRSPSFEDLWTFAGPLIAGAVNLTLLITARDDAVRPTATVPHTGHGSSSPPPHLTSDQVLQPVNLRPFRREQATTTRPPA
jgi:hypothetical protein